ncbi:MAG: hypothetical protein QOE23_1566 [Pseudonocardiales bacterium]|nr:hypothetical protein [Pseudonocardiales bacterium]
MTAMLSRAMQALSVRPVRDPGNPITDGCAPDCVFEYVCTNHRYYRRQCCYTPDCILVCDAWVDISSC